MFVLVATVAAFGIIKSRRMRGAGPLEGVVERERERERKMRTKFW